MANENKGTAHAPIPPGIPNPPNAPDLSRATAMESALAEQERREKQDRMHRAAAVRDSDERLVSRDGGFDENRGGERAFNNADWERAAGPTDPEVRRRIREETIIFLRSAGFMLASAAMSPWAHQWATR